MHHGNLCLRIAYLGSFCLGLMLVSLIQVSTAHGEDQTPPPRGFDYWQPEWMVRELWGPGRMPKGMIIRLLRHTTYIRNGVSKEYEGAKSNVPATQEAIAAGNKLYAENCAGCHGSNGLGNGDMGKALSPSPALLAYMIRRPIAVDEYLLWAISEGGKQFGTQMPAFKSKLSREEVWKIIAYMRAGFPEAEPKHARN